MKKMLLTLLIALALSMTLASSVLAAGQAPSACPPNYELHAVGDHLDHPDHHIGVAVDLNGNGFLCMLPLANGLHVHVDDVIP